MVQRCKKWELKITIFIFKLWLWFIEKDIEGKKRRFFYTKDELWVYGIKTGGQVFPPGTSPFLAPKVDRRGYLDKLFCHMYGVVN